MHAVHPPRPDGLERGGPPDDPDRRSARRHGPRSGRAVAQSLRGARFARAYASPRRRARDTAELALTGVDQAPKVRCDERLVEPTPGRSRACASPTCAAGRRPRRSVLTCGRPTRNIPDGCESLRACADRARGVSGRGAGLQGRSLVASHSLFIRVLACEVLDVVPATYRHFKLSNAYAVGRVKFHPAPPHQSAGLTFRPPEPGGARSFGLWIGHAFDRSRLTGCTPKPGDAPVNMPPSGSRVISPGRPPWVLMGPRQRPAGRA